MDRIFKEPLSLFDIDTLSFTISFDATDSDLANHLIDAKNIGDSIKSLAELIDLADKIINGENTNIGTFLSGSPKPGSVIIEILTKLYSPDAALMALQCIGIIGGCLFVGKNALTALAEIKDSNIIDLHTTDDDEVVTLTLDDGRKIILAKEVAKLVTSPRVRKLVKKSFFRPIQNTIEPTIIIRGQDNAITKVLNSNELESISIIKTNGRPRSEDTFTASVSFEQLNFSKNNTGWRIVLDGSSISVKIKDTNFIKAVSSRSISFTKDDMYNTSIRKITNYDDFDNESYTYEVLKVDI